MPVTKIFNSVDNKLVTLIIDKINLKDSVVRLYVSNGNNNYIDVYLDSRDLTELINELNYIKQQSETNI